MFRVQFVTKEWNERCQRVRKGTPRTNQREKGSEKSERLCLATLCRMGLRTTGCVTTVVSIVKYLTDFLFCTDGLKVSKR